jgi:hypothetical protein
MLALKATEGKRLTLRINANRCHFGLENTDAQLTPMDWVAILIFLVGIWIAIYTTSLRHP